MTISLLDRVVSILTYISFGFFGIIWLVYCSLTKKRNSGFVNFNIFQSIFVSIILAALSFAYGIACGFMSQIPVLGKLVLQFDVFFNETPLYFSMPLSGFLTVLLILYLSIISLLGKKPFIPVISDLTNINSGG